MKICRFNDFVLEDHSQLELPFDHSKRGFGRKPLHVDFIDALEKLAVKMPNYKSASGNWDENIKKIWPEAVREVEIFMDDNSSSREMFMAWLESMHHNGIRPDIFSEELRNTEGMKDNKVLSRDQLYSVMDTIPDFGLSKGLSEKGIALLKKQLPDLIKTVLDDDSVIPNGAGPALDRMQNNFEQDPNNLISCWREMMIDSTRKDIFKEVTDKYRGVGEFWSWSEEGAEPHGGYSSNEKKINVVLCGKTRFEDINWPRTIMVNVWDLREEMELTLKPAGLVKIESIIITGTRHYIGQKNAEEKMQTRRDIGLILPAGRKTMSPEIT